MMHMVGHASPEGGRLELAKAEQGDGHCKELAEAEAADPSPAHKFWEQSVVITVF